MIFTEKLVQFVTNHWAMVAGFIVLLILLFVEEVRSKGMGKQLSVQEAIDLVNRENALVIDTRDSNVFMEAHIAKARNIPRDQIEQNIDKLRAFKQRPVIVVCAKGQSAIQIAAKLRKQGFEKAQSLAGGMQAWKNASMPLKKGK